MLQFHVGTFKKQINEQINKQMNERTNQLINPTIYIYKNKDNNNIHKI